MPKWEYDKIDLSGIAAKAKDIDILNDAGKDGWELVAITRNNVAYLKRQLVDDPPQAEETPTQSVQRRRASPRPRET
jgi:hypothetical protein